MAAPKPVDPPEKPIGPPEKPELPAKPIRPPVKPSPTAGETRPTTIATGASPQTLGRRLSVLLRLEELEHWYPSSRIVRCSSGLALMSVDVGVIRWLPYRGRLLLEIPLDDPPGLIPFPEPTTPFVPMVRVWASWRDGVRPAGDHVYPDASVSVRTWRGNGSGDAILCTCWLTGAPAGSLRVYISSS